jgi:hypothetical protein
LLRNERCSAVYSVLLPKHGHPLPAHIRPDAGTQTFPGSDLFIVPLKLLVYICLHVVVDLVHQLSQRLIDKLRIFPGHVVLPVGFILTGFQPLIYRPEGFSELLSARLVDLLHDRPQKRFVLGVGCFKFFQFIECHDDSSFFDQPVDMYKVYHNRVQMSLLSCENSPNLYICYVIHSWCTFFARRARLSSLASFTAVLPHR